MTALASLYVGLRPDAERQGLEARLERACRRAREAFPDLALEEEAFVAALAGLPRSVHEVSDEAIEDLALGLACARGDASALAILDRDHFEPARAALAAMKLEPAMRDDVVQEVRRKLLVGDPPRIASYAGRGSLRGLLKVTATRIALTMLRDGGRERPSDDALLDTPGAASDPELAFLAQGWRVAFREAFEDAVGRLEPRERNLMRLHFLRRVTLESLATMYGVHRATIVRQLARIRDTLDRATRAGMAERLGARQDELESVMDQIRSRFDVSVERLLRTMEES